MPNFVLVMVVNTDQFCGVSHNYILIIYQIVNTELLTLVIMTDRLVKKTNFHMTQG